MIAGARIVIAAARVQLRQLATDLFMLFTAFLQTFFIALTVMLMLRNRPDFDPIYVVVGAGLTGLWSVALFAGNWGIASERWPGTLELLVASPAPLLLVIAGKMLGGTLLSLTAMATSYAIGAWLFGYDISVRHPAAFAVSLLLGLLSFWSLGLLLAPIGILWRAANRLVNVLEYPVYTLGGFLFPILLLPIWLLPVSHVLPPYWAAVSLHGTSSGDLPRAELLRAWGFLVASSVVAVLLARALFERVLVRARRDGTLALS